MGAKVIEKHLTLSKKMTLVIKNIAKHFSFKKVIKKNHMKD